MFVVGSGGEFGASRREFPLVAVISDVATDFRRHETVFLYDVSLTGFPLSLSVLERRLEATDGEFLSGAHYSIADMAIWGWVVPYKNQGQKLEDFPHLKKWFERMGDRPAVKRGFALGLDLRRGTLGDKSKEAAKARKILFNQRAK